ncbi:response regulator transcription factor [Streptomyces sp. NBC_01363]|uniref:response regulator transcription factor n=1 Tax=Streptomyces sp. NBC_01363 TaxID=2903840 RepID=UPI002253755D|nr:helix-turn-helix transcriptional regulator [Streptomyces sp. NBC_01363]MCX4729841.1 helix-turn-helix transcriptional regulator [Streptomyces sp. NBC_01363]
MPTQDALETGIDPHITARAGVGSVPGDPAAAQLLTGRERQVLVLIGGAAESRAIARRLGIAERTVKAHLSSIIGKLGVSSRLEAALFTYAHH